MSKTLLNESVNVEQLTRNGKDFVAFSRVLPKDENLPEILFLSGLRSDMMGTKAEHLATVCQEKGLGMIRFDYFGHGQSSGDFTDATIGHWLDDTLAVIDEITKAPLIIVGSSLGGWLMTLAALKRPDRVKGLVGIAVAPDFTEELMWAGFSKQQQDEMVSHGMIHLPSDYEEGDFTITHQLIEEGRHHLVLDKALPVTCPLHLLHGTQDKDVPWRFSQKLMDQVQSEDVLLTLIKNGDHRLSGPKQLKVLTNAVERMCQKIKNLD